MALALLLASAALAVDADAPGWSYRLSGDLMSPFCPGRALSECPSPDAAELRAWIVDQEKQGRSREDVRAQLFAQWGDQLRQEPRAEGLGLWAYVVPAVAGVLGLLVVALFLRRQTHTASDAPPAPSPTPTPTPRMGPADAELERIVDAELAD